MPVGGSLHVGTLTIAYPADMTEQPIEDELRRLAEQILAGPDDVAEFAAIHADIYKEQRLIILGMLEVDAMVAGNQGEIDEQHPCLVALRGQFRDRLRRLLAWARDTGRLNSTQRS